MQNRYIQESLELHLFFARIMKEHSLFLEAGFTPANKDWLREADFYKKLFEDILSQVVDISCGMVDKNVLTSGEIITPYTLDAEHQTNKFTGIPINSDITRAEQLLIDNKCSKTNRDLTYIIQTINKRALNAVNQLIEFKQKILKDVLTCKAFTMNYPLLIDHILREAKLYRTYIIALENGQDLKQEDIKTIELFWNRIMMEHALFIRGLLDPTEEDLINVSDTFAKEYNQLLNEAKIMTNATMLKNKTIEETIKYRNFKETGTKGIENCQIKSVILPLLADHVLREANHYLRILKED